MRLGKIMKVYKVLMGLDNTLLIACLISVHTHKLFLNYSFKFKDVWTSSYP